MRNKNLIFYVSIVAVVFSVTLNSCKKSEKATPLDLSSLMAGSIDLNGATSPTDVPVNTTITATFTTDVDATTATSDNITLVQDYDNTDIPLTISATGKTITITPTSVLSNGALYKLSFGVGLMATNGLALTMLERSFTTEGTFVPTGQIAYWDFENTANDEVGSFDPTANGVIDVTYSDSRKAAAGKAATFNGTTSLIEIPNGDQLSNTADFTLAFWVKADTSKHGQYILGLAGAYGFQFEIDGAYGSCKLAAQYDYGDGTSGSEDLWFNGAATNSTKDNGGWQGWTFCKDLTNSGGVKALFANKWAYITCVYNSSTKVGTLYINGEKMKSQDFNLWPAGDKKLGVVGLKYAGNPGNNSLVFGFIQDKNDPTITDSYGDYSNPNSNHFKGMLDDVRIFHKPLTDTEIQLMYNSEKP